VDYWYVDESAGLDDDDAEYGEQAAADAADGILTGEVVAGDSDAGLPGFGGSRRGSRKPLLGRRGEHYSGRHVSARGKTARKRAGKAVPAAAVAATLAAGAAAYTLTSGGHPQAGQLSASMGTVSLGKAGPGTADGAASQLIVAGRAARATAAGKAAAAPRVSVSASATPSALASPVTAHNAGSSKTDSGAANTAAPAAAPPSASASASASATASASPSVSAATTLSCAVTGGLLPDNVTAIVSFLLAHGYSGNAAAGIAGNIYQESKGNPESVGMGGGGLIGWTPLPSGFVTGAPAADLQTQLAALLTYNQGWSGYLPKLQSAATPADAAYIYVTDFERAGIPAAATREQAAADVASACGI
jgi:hypothetical protein